MTTVSRVTIGRGGGTKPIFQSPGEPKWVSIVNINGSDGITIKVNFNGGPDEFIDPDEMLIKSGITLVTVDRADVASEVIVVATDSPISGVL